MMRLHKVTGHNALPDLSRADVLLVLIASVTEVEPEPAGTGLGLNVAVAPLGNPVAVKLTAAGKVVCPDGVIIHA
jgi:hypothetical protein